VAARHATLVALPSMSDGSRSRLDPEVFDLPVEKIRDGYYTDAYFSYARSALLADGRHPRVLMQVFQKKDAILGCACAGRQDDIIDTESAQAHVEIGAVERPVDALRTEKLVLIWIRLELTSDLRSRRPRHRMFPPDRELEKRGTSASLSAGVVHSGARSRHDVPRPSW
jgi:hypothetical protein